MGVLINILLAAWQACTLIYLIHLWAPALAAMVASSRKRSEGDVRPRQERSFAILITAHNEEAVIGALLWSVALQQYPVDKYRVYVVANNCTDSTATVVRSTRFANCFERSDGDLATKGASLIWLWERIAEETRGCDCVLILDADNLIAPDFLMEINRVFEMGFRVVQSARCAKNASDSWASELDAVSELLWNRLDQTGRMELGLSATIAGSGTAFDRAVFERLISERVRCLCEDVEWQARLMMEGIRVGYAAKARVYDEKTKRAGQLERQRRRWIAGAALAARHYGIPLLARGLKTKNMDQLVAGVTATKPPRSLLSISMGLLALAGVLFPDNRFMLPWTFWAGAAGSLSIYVLLGMLLGRVELKSYLALLYVPIFMVLILLATVAAVFRASKQRWVPTAHERGISIDQIYGK